jgi:Uma2 family endonuclease
MSIITRDSGDVIATGVSFEEYLERYASDYCELVQGFVIKMSPETLDHDKKLRYLTRLLETYFELRPIGQVVDAPFVMRVKRVDVSREPDLQVILHSNPAELTNTYMNGPADICIEIVSAESISRDHGDKFLEYEKAGVPEYWILDPLRNETRFYRMDAGRYIPFYPDAEGNYRTPALPGFVLHVPTLWQEELPGPIAVGHRVQAMLKAEDEH